ncbi:hypothetical protein GE09DRAFT_1214528 [Coniochaeta sp. 2T2.1]|nr:hypothetical protein GE09DRAFT_1214528 [Coniochaeta sp. 2T2.1]
MPEQVAYEVPSNSLTVRPHTQQQLPQQQAYYAPPYNGGSAMPAPSSLLGIQMAQAPLYPPVRTASTYHGLPPPPSSGTQEYPATGYDDNLYSKATGYTFLPAPSSFPSQQLSYPQAYGQQQMWALQPQHRTPAKPTSVYGPLTRETWERVFEHLPYADRLRLQSVNHFWAKSLKSIDQRIKANPTDAEFADMHSTVLKAENYRRHWAPSLSTESKPRCGRPRSNAGNPPPPPAALAQLDADDDEAADGKGGKRAPPGSVGNLGCYHCFTVQPPEKFCLLSNDPGQVDRSSSSSSTGEHHDAQFHSHSQHPQPPSIAAAPSSNDNNSNKNNNTPGIRRYCIDCGIKKGYHPSNKYLERKWGIEVWICCGAINEHGVMNCPSCRRGCPLTPVNKSSRRSTTTTAAAAGNKRSSPAMPPPAATGSRPQKQHRVTAGVGRHGLDQPLYQYHWPEIPGGVTHHGYPT